MNGIMKIFKMSGENPDMDLIGEAIEIMAGGGVILYPTDTVYGLGANIFNNDAIVCFGSKHRKLGTDC